VGSGFADGDSSTLKAYDPAYKTLSVPNKILTLSLGNAWLKSGSAQSLSLLPPFENYYSAHQTYRSALMGGLFLGIEYWKNPLLALQLGMGGYVYSSVNVSGSVLQFGMPQFSNFNYNYHIRSQRLVAEGKVLTTLQNWLHPYISGNVGMAADKAYGYRESPLASDNVPMLPFTNRSNPSFTYSVGAGFDLDISRSFRLGVGYQYDDLGKFLLGRSPAQSTNEVLNSQHLGSHEIKFQVTAVG